MSGLEQELDFASGIVHALLDLSTLGTPLDRAELARRRAEAMQLFDASPRPAAVFDHPRRPPRLANLAWRKLFGARGLPPAACGYVDTVVSTGTTIHLGDLALEAREAADAYAVTFRPVRGGDGTPTGAIVVCTLADADTAPDLLAEALAARADAEQANRLKDQFLAAVSHELRAPLTTLLLWEKVLCDDANDAATHAQARLAIRESVHAQSRLVGDLLDVARAISGKLYIDLRTVDIASIARDAIGAAAHAAHAKDIAIAHEGALVAIEIPGDATRLRQVLDNLLSNAVKFTAPGGKITVAVQRRERSVVIEVADTGRGIAPEFMARIFEPFSQTDDALTRRDGGLGLGLAISRQLAELHEGTLVASSEGHGRGTKLTLSLRASVRDAPSPPIALPSTPRLERTAILVVDDDRRVREALALLLDRAGAAVQTADSAASARERIATVAPDLVLCDIAMPDEDGYTFIRKLRATGNAVPVIALTAHAMEADAERALAAGFDVHLAKPIDFERLVAKIDELVGARA